MGYIHIEYNKYYVFIQDTNIWDPGLETGTHWDRARVPGPKGLGPGRKFWVPGRARLGPHGSWDPGPVPMGPRIQARVPYIVILYKNILFILHSICILTS